MDHEYLKETYPQVAEAYPKVFNFNEWVGFLVTRSTVTYNQPSHPYPKYHHAGPILYVKASPGNATEYRFWVIDGDISIAFPEGRKLLVFDPDQRWGSMWIKDFDIHPSYFTQKLGMGDADAVAMAVILGRLDDGKQ